MKTIDKHRVGIAQILLIIIIYEPRLEKTGESQNNLQDKILLTCNVVMIMLIKQPRKAQISLCWCDFAVLALA